MVDAVRGLSRWRTMSLISLVLVAITSCTTPGDLEKFCSAIAVGQQAQDVIDLAKSKGFSPKSNKTTLFVSVTHGGPGGAICTASIDSDGRVAGIQFDGVRN